MTILFIALVFALFLVFGVLSGFYLSGVWLLAITLGLAAGGYLLAQWMVSRAEWSNASAAIFFYGYVVPAAVGYGIGACVAKARKR